MNYSYLDCGYFTFFLIASNGPLYIHTKTNSHQSFATYSKQSLKRITFEVLTDLEPIWVFALLLSFFEVPMAGIVFRKTLECHEKINIFLVGNNKLS